MLDLVAFLLKKLNLVPVTLFDVTLAICRAQAILVANELGIFPTLNATQGGLTAEELARRIEISEEGSRQLLGALEKTGYLKIRNGHYQTARCVKRWITHPEEGFSNFIKMDGHLWGRLSELEKVVRTGQPTRDFQGDFVQPSNEQNIYTLGLKEVAQFLIPAFIKKVRLPNRSLRLMDIGGAHGDYSRALVQKFPGLQATIFDLPGPIASAQRMLEETGNPEKLELVAGDAFRDNLGSDWDVVLLANMVHLFSAEQNTILLGRIFHALGPGGILLVLDQFRGMSSLSDKISGVLSLSLFTVGGKMYHHEEMEDMLRSVGFRGTKKTVCFPRVFVTLMEAAKT